MVKKLARPRDRGSARECGRPANHCAINKMLRSVLDGLVISDGSYPKTASDVSSYLSLSSIAVHEDWVVSIKESLHAHGMEAKIKNVAAGQRRVRRGVHAGSIIKANPSVKIATKSYRELLGERRRWYSTKGVKRIPRDFDVTNPVTLAHWHMGDGNAVIHRNRLTIKLHTNGFLEKDVSWLKDQFRSRLGIECSISHWRDQPILTMYNREAVKFTALVRPHMASSFSYKAPEDPWKPGSCKVCSALIHDRRSSAKYCRRHRRRLRAYQYPNRPNLRCIRCDALIKNKIYSGKYCSKHREEVRREHVARMHKKRAEARRAARNTSACR